MLGSRHLGFIEGDAYPEDGVPACGRDAQGDEDGTVAELPAGADLFVSGSEHQIGRGTQGGGAAIF